MSVGTLPITLVGGQIVQPNGVTDDFQRKSTSMKQWFRVFHGPSLSDLDLTLLDTTSGQQQGGSIRVDGA